MRDLSVPHSHSGPAIIPLVPASLTGSSNLPGSANGPFDELPYLVLLRAGFGLPLLLPGARWALTPPFHPYPSCPRRYIFCATVRRVAPPGCYPAHCPVEFGLSSPTGTSPLAERLPMAAIARLTAANQQVVRPSGFAPSGSNHPSLVKSGTAPASYTDYFAAYRSPRLFSICSIHSLSTWTRDTRARSRT